MTTLEIFISSFIPIICGIFYFVMTDIYKRLGDQELRLRNAITDKDVRAIIADKIDPLKEDIHEIKQKLDRLIELREKK